MFRHQFAQHQGQEGGDDDDDGQRDRLGIGGEAGEALQPVLQMGGDAGAAEDAGQNADQGDADLDSRQEALRLVRQRAGGGGACDPLPFQYRKARTAGRDQGKLAQRKQPVEHDQQQDDDGFKTDGHGSSGSG